MDGPVEQQEVWIGLGARDGYDTPSPVDRVEGMVRIPVKRVAFEAAMGVGIEGPASGIHATAVQITGDPVTYERDVLSLATLVSWGPGTNRPIRPELLGGLEARWEEQNEVSLTGCRACPPFEVSSLGGRLGGGPVLGAGVAVGITERIALRVAATDRIAIDPDARTGMRHRAMLGVDLMVAAHRGLR